MKKTWFLNWFPVPNFLRMPSVGLDISDGYIRFVELVDGDYGKILGRYGKVRLPDDVVFKGEIKDKIKLINILKSIKQKHRFEFVRVSVVENQSYIFRTRILKSKDMSRDEVRAALSFKLEENVPIKPNEAVFDFDIIGSSGKNLDIVVSVLPKQIIDRFVEVLDEVGLIPLSFEVEAQAVARSTITSGDKNTYMIVDFRKDRASISIVSGGSVQFTSTLDIGGDDITHAIEKHLSVTFEEAEKKKNEKGFVKIDSNDELFYAMMNTVAALKDEMNKYIIYWHTHKDNLRKDGKIDRKVEKIVLCGSNGALKGLDDYLSLSMGLNVDRANVWKNIFSLDNYVPEMNFFESSEYAAAIGLATRTDDTIFLPNNLTLIDKKEKQK